MKNYILLITMSLCFLGPAHPSYGESAKEDVIYKLALIHTQALNPDKALLGADIKPDDATISEFRWLIETLEGRCKNTVTELANTIVSAWKLIKSRGYPMTLLEATRGLTTTVKKTTPRNIKADFTATSGLWTSKFKPKN